MEQLHGKMDESFYATFGSFSALKEVIKHLLCFMSTNESIYNLSSSGAIFVFDVGAHKKQAIHNS